MAHTKLPAVAGAFYPASRKALLNNLAAYLDKPKHHPCPKAIIAPHAGYIYSGPIAGSAYACLLAYQTQITRVILFGPGHRHYFTGLAVSSANDFATPLGKIPVDAKSLEAALSLSFVQTCDPAFETEHSLEVQLPFLQAVLKHFSILPCLVGNASEEQVVEVIEHLWGGPETLIVVSSDLSHYHPYVEAQKMDSAASQAINTLDWEAIDDQQACGRVPLRALLQVAKKRGLKAKTLDLRNSGDTAGPKDRVVGYGAFHLVSQDD